MKFLIHSIIILIFIQQCIVGNPLTDNEYISWSQQTNGIIYAKPVVENNILYVGSLDNYFYALNADTGDIIWKFETAGKIYTTAALDENIICIKGGNVVYVLDYDGNLIWEKSLSDSPPIYTHDNWDYYHSNPVIYNGVIYIGYEKGKLFGFSLDDGEIVFEATTSVKSTIETAPLIYNNKIIVGDFYGLLTAFNLEDGSIEWDYDTNNDKNFSPGWANDICTEVLIYNGDLFFGGKNCRFYRMNPETGESIAQFVSPTDQWLVGGPTFDGEYIFFGSSNQKVLHKVKISTMELEWTTNVDARIFGTPLIVDNFIYVGTSMGISTGSFYAIDKETGEIAIRHNFSAEINSSPTHYDGKIYFGSSNKSIYAIDIEAFLSEITDIKQQSFGLNEYKLYQNYPNPFNPSTIINYTISNSVMTGHTPSLPTMLIVYNVLGKKVETLVNEKKSPGNYSIKFEASNLTSGIYYYQLTCGKFSETKKMIFVK